MPRRSTWTCSRLSGAALSFVISTTRKPSNPRIQVHSRSDPTRPPLLVTHQEKTTPGGPVSVGSRSFLYTRWPEPPPEAPYVHRPPSPHHGGGGGVKGGAVQPPSVARAPLTPPPHRGQLRGRWTPAHRD